MFIEPVNTHHINPYDLAIDPYARMVYWTDTARKVIAVTRIDGEGIGIIVDDVDARSLALAPEEGCVDQSFLCIYLTLIISRKSVFSALTLIGRQEGHSACENFATKPLSRAS